MNPPTVARESRSFVGANEATHGVSREILLTEHWYDAGATVEDGGAVNPRLRVVLSGWLGLCSTLADGRRHILQLLLPGEVCGLATLAPSPGRFTIVALTRAQVGDCGALAEVFQSDDPDRDIVKLWARRFSNHQRLLDNIVRLGRLSAVERMADLLLELYGRTQRVGLTRGPTMLLPLTQEILAQHLGISAVHVNRVLHQLRRDGLIVYRRGRVTFADFNGLAALAHRQPRAIVNEDRGSGVVPFKPPVERRAAP